MRCHLTAPIKKDVDDLAPDAQQLLAGYDIAVGKKITKYPLYTYLNYEDRGADRCFLAGWRGQVRGSSGVRGFLLGTSIEFNLYRVDSI